MQSSLSLQNGNKTIIHVSINDLILSRFNPRRSRNPQEVERLASRIQRNGFEVTRALWAYQVGEVYEVFAGGTRLEAARLAEIAEVPIVLHVGFTPYEIARLADEDNENDEYHTPVSIVDVWADYARLSEEEGWTQQEIVNAKGVSQTMVSVRLKLHCLPLPVKTFISQGALGEEHGRAISELLVTNNLSRWLGSSRAQEELAAKAAHDAGKNGGKTVKAVREDVAVWKEFIAEAEATYRALSVVTLHDLRTNPPTPYLYDAPAAFVEELARLKARSLPKVRAAESVVRKFIANSLSAYERHVANQSSKAAEETERLHQEQEMLSKLHLGDCVKVLQAWDRGPIKLLLTDPPYGMDYQSNRRWASKAPSKIAGDGKSEAAELLRATVEAALPHLADDAHVLVFSVWDWDATRRVLEGAGLTVKPTLIWLKDEHTSGDVHGSFGVDYEAIVHAVKGSPRVTPRHRTTFHVARTRDTDHPNEKPLALLKALIECTTTEGDLVADPFAGGGSTLVAALKASRDFWGAEVDESHYEKACTRLLKEVTNGTADTKA